MDTGGDFCDDAVVRVTVDHGGRDDGDDVWKTDRSTRGGERRETGGEPERERRLLEAARTASDQTTVLEVGSTGVRALEPLVLVTCEGRTAYHVCPSAERVRSLVERADSGEVGADDARWVVEHDPDADALPTPSDGPLAVGARGVLGACGWTDPDGDATGARAATFARNDPERAFDRLCDVGVRGRGRGDASKDAPVADELETARETPGDPVVVVNANESDPRNDADRTLLAGAPATVLDGAIAVAAIVGADPSDVVVYANEGDNLARNRTRRAARTVVDALGRETNGDDGETNVDGTDTPQVVAGPSEYIAGEPTMALEALEGNDRLEARLRPPGPARHGLYGRPTVVHTPRTVAQIRRALLDPDAFDASDADPGTRVFTVTGDVETPATIELPTGGSLAEVRDAVDADGGVEMACVGGQFGGFTRSLDHGASSVALAGADLGTAGVVELFGENRCPVATAGKRTRFASEENCGRCFPCREGSKQLLDLLRDVYDGSYEDDMIRELTRTMESSSLCYFGQSAARTVGTAVERFETEFEAHADGRCPSGVCEVSR
ncbi:NADH-ubiquinone oxidoreductase-F iron-sulfur binding region domain-containing protein [Halorussus salinisoli]|uniref:NADH-ubiquinone oxidoreductase-F iron-sulfur binding region domain-containing protein n=1 Tax=Halorussus salinisoli TaxID=2558242 RepID=UPI0010C1BE09|nr:NADH-ubiquinone oxidoreductase-F iron-sulfur binding region domain-containing protein [Halorussus salinisoli]